MFDDVEYLVHRPRVGPGNDRVQRGIGLNGGLDRGFRFAIGASADQLAQRFGKLGGVGVGQVDHLGIAHRGRRHIQLVDEIVHHGQRLRFAPQQEAVVTFVGDDADGLGTDRSLRHLFGRHLFQDGDDRTCPGVLEGAYDHFVVVQHIEFPDDLPQAFHVVRVVADDDDVAVGDGAHVAVLRAHWPQYLDEFRGLDVLHRYQLRDHFLAGHRRSLPDHTAGLLDRVDVLDNVYDVSVADGHGAHAVYAQHGQKQVVDLIPVERRLRDDADSALDARIYDEGLAGDVGDLRDELQHVDVRGIDGPRLGFCGGILCRDDRGPNSRQHGHEHGGNDADSTWRRV